MPFFQEDEIQTTKKRMSSQFNDMTFYCAPVPTYYGGFMTFAWGCDNETTRQHSLTILENRFKKAKIHTRYYNPEIHQAAFALPQYIRNVLVTRE